MTYLHAVPDPAFLRLRARPPAPPPDARAPARRSRPNVSIRNGRADHDRRRHAGRRARVPLGRRLDRPRHDRRALPPRPGGIRDGVGLRHAPRREDRPPGAQRARHRHRDDVWLGARVFVGAGVTIGDGCVVSANSVVTRVVAAETRSQSGIPARIVRRREDYATAEAGEPSRRRSRRGRRAPPAEHAG